MGLETEPVLVLNQNYEPLNVCTVRRALVLLDRGKAEIVENGRGYLHTPTLRLPVPSVIRLVYLIRRPRPNGRLTRRDVFLRDAYTCQYCGKQTRDLTLDHVTPRHRGGTHDWENVVAACRACNHKKAGRTPQEAHMRLLRRPTRPPNFHYRIFYPYLGQQVEWRKFIPGWESVPLFL
jgi:5-methylcytosine-specific restriction endonuclease McrA